MRCYLLKEGRWQHSKYLFQHHSRKGFESLSIVVIVVPHMGAQIQRKYGLYIVIFVLISQLPSHLSHYYYLRKLT